MLHLFSNWERLQLKVSNYKSHRIFTLRCIHKELVPVNMKLKTTLKTEKTRKIIKAVEKYLLQARIKYKNSILDNVTKQAELCRSKLASILSTPMFRKCQGFIEKVGEIRFNKVKNRQVNKFNNLSRKEGNITGVSTQLTTFSSSQPSRQVGRQAGCQAGTPLWDSMASQEASASQAGRQVPTFQGTPLLLRQSASPLITVVSQFTA